MVHHAASDPIRHRHDAHTMQGLNVKGQQIDMPSMKTAFRDPDKWQQGQTDRKIAAGNSEISQMGGSFGFRAIR